MTDMRSRLDKGVSQKRKLGEQIIKTVLEALKNEGQLTEDDLSNITEVPLDKLRKYIKFLEDKNLVKIHKRFFKSNLVDYCGQDAEVLQKKRDKKRAQKNAQANVKAHIHKVEPEQKKAEPKPEPANEVPDEKPAKESTHEPEQKKAEPKPEPANEVPDEKPAKEATPEKAVEASSLVEKTHDEGTSDPNDAAQDAPKEVKSSKDEPIPSNKEVKEEDKPPVVEKGGMAKQADKEEDKAGEKTEEPKEIIQKIKKDADHTLEKPDETASKKEDKPTVVGQDDESQKEDTPIEKKQDTKSPKEEKITEKKQDDESPKEEKSTEKRQDTEPEKEKAPADAKVKIVTESGAKGVLKTHGIEDFYKEFIGAMRMYAVKDSGIYIAALLVKKGIVVGASFEFVDEERVITSDPALSKIRIIFSGTEGDLELFIMDEPDFDDSIVNNRSTKISREIRLEQLGIKILQKVPEKKAIEKRSLFSGIKGMFGSKPKKAEKDEDPDKEAKFQKKVKRLTGVEDLIQFARAAAEQRGRRFKKRKKPDNVEDTQSSDEEEKHKRVKKPVDALKIEEPKAIHIKKIEGATVKTPIDRLYEYVEAKGTVKINDLLAKSLKIDKEQIESWALILEEHQLLEVRYSTMGEPEIVSLNLKKEEKKDGKGG